MKDKSKSKRKTLELSKKQLRQLLEFINAPTDIKNLLGIVAVAVNTDDDERLTAHCSAAIRKEVDIGGLFGFAGSELLILSMRELVSPGEGPQEPLLANLPDLDSIELHKPDRGPQ